MNYMMGMQDILNYLPHRYPFLLIDCILQLEKGKSVTALKNITMNEPFFQGHFPGKPIMPGVLMIEAMAQAGAVLAYKTTDTTAADGDLYYFAGIDEARFKRVVVPGDQLRLEVTVLRSKRDVWKLSGQAYVGSELACSAIFLSAKKRN